MSIFDSHIHLNSSFFKNNLDFLNKNIKNHFYNNVGTNLEDSLIAIKQAKNKNNVFCSVGVHPLEINKTEINETFQTLEKHLSNNKKIIAIGETGLDFYKVSKEENYKSQILWLKKHCELSRKYNLPLILHIRNAHQEALNFLKKEKNIFGIVHSFDGEIEDLKRYLFIEGFMISISPICIRKIEKFKQIIKILPIDKILIETDAPWLTKSPRWVYNTINFISEIKNIPIKDVKKYIWENTLKIFKLKIDYGE